MDAADTGFFEYDDRFPPFCIRDARTKVPEEVVDAQITQYLQESYKEGIKHADAILPCGMSAGEAGVMYLRKMNSKRRRLDKVDVDVDQILKHITESLRRHMDIDVTSRQHRPIFLRCVTPEVFQTKQYRRKMMQAIKLFLKEANMKTKGYTAKLRNVMTTINAQINALENPSHNSEHGEDDDNRPETSVPPNKRSKPS